MTADMQVLCHDYVSIVLRPSHYRGSRLDRWERIDEIRIRLHREMCAAFDCDPDIVADALDKASWFFGVDPFKDPYFDINAVSDKFVEAMERVERLPPEERHPVISLSDKEAAQLADIKSLSDILNPKTETEGGAE